MIGVFRNRVGIFTTTNNSVLNLTNSTFKIIYERLSLNFSFFGAKVKIENILYIRVTTIYREVNFVIDTLDYLFYSLCI